MDTNEIKAHLTSAKEEIEAKGYRARYGECVFELEENGYARIKLDLVPNDEPSDWSTYEDIRCTEKGSADELRELFSRFRARVASVLPVSDVLRGRWRQKLADLTEEGENLGFALEYVEMLRATAAKLAENALPAPHARD